MTGAIVLDPEHRPLRVEAELVIGADGVGSAVARLAEASVIDTARTRRASCMGIGRASANLGTIGDYREGASVGVIQTNAGKHCVFVAYRRNASGPNWRATGWRDFDASCGRPRRELRTNCPVRSSNPGFGHSPVRRDSCARQLVPPGHWWGDAGYFKDPLTAHGITDALRDAELLANAVVEGTNTALARYGSIRDALSLPLFRITDEIAALRGISRPCKACMWHSTRQ